ncbi:MFS transporter [Gluconacetobacter azotocaptans]|uniref:MFS transporter n=1 Tax=Gluconacetobacter azotocaptans TaxID=142834 RepID=A0A7W4JT84_9PROT|nr:MFS transporter [Gluconacetobacter azotocaptans]MBB2190506.1 MFS transporter [Gluconacetobacter azotocaptans]
MAGTQSRPAAFGRPVALNRAAPHAPIITDIPARLDRLPWSRFHVLVVIALGITWILDGLEVTIVGSVAPVLQRSDTLGLSAEGVGAAASSYVAGAVIGALLFGWMSDRLGRRQIFTVTLGLYILGVGLTALSWNLASFALFRLITGLGIGGEYSAINSAIDELMPARLRGRVDLIVNGTFWAGAALGAAGSMLLLQGTVLPVTLAWRLIFGIGALMGLGVIALRRWVPESPRWLMTHRRVEEATRIVVQIEARHGGSTVRLTETLDTVSIHPAGTFGLREALRVLSGPYRGRAGYVLVLMIAQAFLYNAVFFTYGLVLTRYDHVADASVGLYILPLAVGNFLGPLALGKWFDTLGRRRMIVLTYSLAGILMFVVSVLFAAGMLDARLQTTLWVVIFFFASAAASAAYLTASEIFPLEIRALTIALFYALGTLFGGVAAPFLFGWLIGRGSLLSLATGYGAAALLMLIAAAVTARWGVDAEGQSLERIAPPLSSMM